MRDAWDASEQSFSWRRASVEKQLRAVVAAAAWQRECDTPAVVGDSRAHAALIDAMDALYETLDALASVGVKD